MHDTVDNTGKVFVFLLMTGFSDIFLVGIELINTILFNRINWFDVYKFRK